MKMDAQQETTVTAANDGVKQDAAPFEAGVLLVDKPAGLSSFRVVQQIRRALNIKKVGHAGTLDPFATGLLIVCVGRQATRMVPKLMAGDKEYEAVLRLGIETDSHDIDGRIVNELPVEGIDVASIKSCLARFVGEQLQEPPAFSALKHKGKPLYHYARKGIVVTKEPRLVTVHKISCLEFDGELLRIRVACSKGTYIRVLAADIGRVLGCGAHLAKLRRLQSGCFSVDEAIDGTLLADTMEARKFLPDKLLSVGETLKRLTSE